MSEEKPPEPPRQPPPLVPLLQQQPTTLDYRAGDGKYRARTPVVIQTLLGFILWVIGLVAIIAAATQAGPGTKLPGVPVIAVVGVILVAIGALTIHLRLRYRWRGFLPGVLIGLSLTCLIPVAIVWMICGPPFK